MKLTLYRTAGGRVEIVGSVLAGEENNALLKEFPEVWGANGRKLLPADGLSYLKAVHEELGKGTDCWTELTPAPRTPQASVS